MYITQSIPCFFGLKSKSKNFGVPMGINSAPGIMKKPHGLAYHSIGGLKMAKNGDFLGSFLGSEKF